METTKTRLDFEKLVCLMLAKRSILQIAELPPGWLLGIAGNVTQNGEGTRGGGGGGEREMGRDGDGIDILMIPPKSSAPAIEDFNNLDFISMFESSSEKPTKS